MLLGYSRVSTDDQTADLQLDALRAAGCERTFAEKALGATADRPVLEKLIDQLRAGDAVVVWRLDRLGRSLPHLIATVARIEAAGAGLRSLTEGIDTTTANGRLVFHPVRRAGRVRAGAHPRADARRPRRRPRAAGRAVARRNSARRS